jgi:hypothetical protein
MKKVIFILLAGLLMAASATVSVQAKGVVRLYRNQVGCYPEQEKSSLSRVRIPAASCASWHPTAKY